MSVQQEQKTYKKPELIVYGTVSQITMLTGTGLLDDNNGMAPGKSMLDMTTN
jgi:hypothetical protein